MLSSILISCSKLTARRSSLSRRFTVLALESSADDTCAAIVDSSRNILANVVLKQNIIHEPYGGINPFIAMESYQRNMPYAVRSALDTAGFDIARDIDGIAFTRGPGMPGCLSVGMNAAKTLAAALKKPIMGVHHMQGHALTPLLTSWPNPPTFPFLTLLVSGGHTLLLLAKSLQSFQVLATTQDESIGRSFDKVSKLLDLKWTKLGPGDALEKFCAEDPQLDLPSIPPFPRPLVGQLEFSFASLHSHAKLFIERQGGSAGIDILTKKALARAFQAAAVAHLEEKLLLGLNWCRIRNIPVRDIVVSGGVASNNYLRERYVTYFIDCIFINNRLISLRHCLLTSDSNTQLRLVFPPPYLCTGSSYAKRLESIPDFRSSLYQTMQS
ncbi:Gcp-like domain-containing protein [Crassisporium funariophilum]|nr:Gcp-like domain-containing protein [Crassisporium funariophilum]